MRIYRPTYTKPLPENATILKRKDGKYAKFKSSHDRKTKEREARLTKNSKGILVETSHWHIDFEDNLGVKRKLKAFTDKQATRRLADNIERMLQAKANNMPFEQEVRRSVELMPETIRRQLIDFDLLDDKDSAIGKPLARLVDDYRQSLEADERNQGYISETVSQIGKVFDGCSFRYFTDISANKVQVFLQDLRNGPKQLSYETSNHYLKAVKLFCNWCVKRGYVLESPLRSLHELDPELDRRHERRALSIDEIKRLLYATMHGPELYGMDGFERFLLYRFVMETALRANEIRQLRKADFDFANSCVVVKATTAKGKRKDVQQLRPELSQDIEKFLENRLPQAKVFGGRYVRLTDKTSKMIKADLANAGVDYQDEAGRVFDFHSLRGQCSSLLTASGVHPKVAQTIMRHKDINLTMNTYTHVLRGGEARALEQLPDFSFSAIESEQQAVMTGTDDKQVDSKSLPKSCFSNEQMRTTTVQHEQRNPIPESETGFQARPKGLEPSTFGSTVRCKPHLTGQKRGKFEKLVSGLFSDEKIDPDLIKVIEVWPTLSVKKRKDILDAIRSETDG